MISVFVPLVAHAAAWTNEWIWATPELQSIPGDAGRGGSAGYRPPLGLCWQHSPLALEYVMPRAHLETNAFISYAAAAPYPFHFS